MTSAGKPPDSDDDATAIESMSRIGLPPEVRESSVERLLKQLTVDAERRLQFGAVIGKGGMGTVRRARDVRLRRDVAVKELDARLAGDLSSVVQFIQEARVAACLDHPNAAPVHDLGVRDGRRAYFTMKFVEGWTLRDEVNRRPLAERTYHQLLDQLGAVVQAAHAASAAHDIGFAHCDIKPANIMIGRFGAVYLMDWGLARPIGIHVHAAAGEDDEPLITGTPAYMAPEQARGDRVDERTDVFALGGCLYYILTGKPPFGAKTAERAIRLARKGRVVPPSEVVPGIPPGLEAIVMRALAKDPDARYPSAETLADALVAFERGAGEFPTVDYAAGDTIIREGDEADAAFVIVSGRCRVTKDRDGAEVELRTMGVGEVFGETAIIADLPRTATVTAIEPTSVYRITRAVFESEMRRWSPWVGDFVLQLARRLAER